MAVREVVETGVEEAVEREAVTDQEEAPVGVAKGVDVVRGHRLEDLLEREISEQTKESK